MIERTFPCAMVADAFQNSGARTKRGTISQDKKELTS